MTVEMTRRWWMLGKASSSQSPIASIRLFGSTLSVDCQSVFHLRTSFPRDLGNEMSFSQYMYAFYFIIQLWPDKLKNFPKWGLQPPQPSPWICLCMDTEVRARPLVTQAAQEEENPSSLVSLGVETMKFSKALAKEVHETTRNTSASPGYWKAGNWQVLLSDINDISGRYQCVLGQ